MIEQLAKFDSFLLVLFFVYISAIAVNIAVFIVGFIQKTYIRVYLSKKIDMGVVKTRKTR